MAHALLGNSCCMCWKCLRNHICHQQTLLSDRRDLHPIELLKSCNLLLCGSTGSSEGLELGRFNERLWIFEPAGRAGRAAEGEGKLRWWT
eukprot:2732289-Amphidinium_carterae.1